MGISRIVCIIHSLSTALTNLKHHVPDLSIKSQAWNLILPGLQPESSYTADESLRSSSGNHFPELHVSFIKRQRSLTEEALRPSAAPIVAQSGPCFDLKLKKELIVIH